MSYNYNKYINESYNSNIVINPVKNSLREYEYIMIDKLTKISQREIYIELDSINNIITGITEDNIFYSKKDYIKKFIIDKYKLIENNITKVHLLYYNWLGNCEGNFNMKSKLNIENGKISYINTGVNELIDNFQKDKTQNNYKTYMFNYLNEYKYDRIREQIPYFDETFKDFGIEYDFIYEPIGFLPEYSISGNLNFDLNSLTVYGLDLETFKDIYNREFRIDDVSKDIDVYTHNEEIEWLSNLLYEDCYTMKKIIKDINPNIDFGLGLDFYLTIGNQPSDDIKSLNLYGEFQRKIMFNEKLVYPFADFLYIDRINYDIVIGNINNNKYLPSEKIDTRSLNERIEAINDLFKYPLNKISIGMIIDEKNFNDTDSNIVSNVYNEYTVNISDSNNHYLEKTGKTFTFEELFNSRKAVSLCRNNYLKFSPNNLEDKFLFVYDPNILTGYEALTYIIEDTYKDFEVYVKSIYNGDGSDLYIKGNGTFTKDYSHRILYDFDPPKYSYCETMESNNKEIRVFGGVNRFFPKIYSNMKLDSKGKLTNSSDFKSINFGFNINNPKNIILDLINENFYRNENKTDYKNQRSNSILSYINNIYIKTINPNIIETLYKKDLENSILYNSYLVLPDRRFIKL